MPRSCARPGCSEDGVVAYGLAPRLLLAWLAPLESVTDPTQPLLCRRHADRTTVPDGWTFDDRREPAPRLFQLPPPVDEPARVEPPDHLAPVVPLRPRPQIDEPVLPLELPDVDTTHDESSITVATSAEPAPVVTGPDEAARATGAPNELDDLLAARSPLLARAFHGRPRS